VVFRRSLNFYIYKPISLARSLCCMIQRLFGPFMGSTALIELYVWNTKLFRKRGVMSPFQWRVITNEALPDWYHRFDNKALQGK
jgi:hypothetical protein